MAESNTSSKTFLIVALVLGVLATLITFLYLNSISGKDLGKRVEILVAAVDLMPNQKLDAKHLVVREVPASSVGLLGNVHLKSAQTFLIGKRINREITAGTPVYVSDLSASPDIDLTPGKLAMSLPSRETYAVGGLIDPGDWVRIAVVVSITPTEASLGGSTDPNAVSRPDTMDNTFIESSGGRVYVSRLASAHAFRVLSIGHRTVRASDMPTNMGRRALLTQQRMQSITLEVSQEHARQLLERTAGNTEISVMLLARGGSRLADELAANDGKTLAEIAKEQELKKAGPDGGASSSTNGFQSAGGGNSSTNTSGNDLDDFVEGGE